MHANELKTQVLFGVRLIMVPSYVVVILVKAYLSVSLFMHPHCFNRAMVLWNVHSVYAWCRVFISLFERYGLLEHHVYTVAIVLACPPTHRATRVSHTSQSAVSV